MLQPRGRANLLEEALRSKRRGQVIAQDLDRHLSVVAHIVREIHGGHATSPELAPQRVAAFERLRELNGKSAHVGGQIIPPRTTAFRRQGSKGSRQSAA